MPKTKPRRVLIASTMRAGPKDRKIRPSNNDDGVVFSASKIGRESTPESRPFRSSDGLESIIYSSEDGECGRKGAIGGRSKEPRAVIIT